MRTQLFLSFNLLISWSKAHWRLPLPIPGMRNALCCRQSLERPLKVKKLELGTLASFPNYAMICIFRFTRTKEYHWVKLSKKSTLKLFRQIGALTMIHHSWKTIDFYFKVKSQLANVNPPSIPKWKKTLLFEPQEKWEFHVLPSPKIRKLNPD